MWFVSIIVLILMLGLIILVHEFGHFIWAKIFKVHIYEFSIGMGPILFTHVGKDKVHYNLRAVPIGGFVSMAGEVFEDGEKLAKDKYMCNKPWWQRIIILAAGVTNNFILAILVLFLSGLIWGVPNEDPIITTVAKDTPAERAGLKAGDEITKINGHNVSTWDVSRILLLMRHDEFSIEVKHDNGKVEEYKIKPDTIEQEGIKMNYFGIGQGNCDLNCDTNADGFPDTKLDLDNDGKIDNDIVNTNDKEITYELNIDLDEDGICDLNCDTNEDGIPEYNIDFQNNRVATFNIMQEDGTISNPINRNLTSNSHGILLSIKYAFSKFASTIRSMAYTIGGLVTGKISLKALSGPVGIYEVVDESVSVGIDYVIFLIAFLSINVGFINILPLPAFDGGRILFVIIEKIKGSPVDPKVENMIHNIGFILLMLLMIVITIQDILRLF